MRSVSDLDTGTKLALSFGLMAALIAIVGTVGIRGMAGMRGNMAELYEKEAVSVDFMNWFTSLSTTPEVK